MKKQIALHVLFLALALPIHAQYLLNRQEHTHLNKKLESTVTAKHTIQSTLTVIVPITKQYFTDTNKELKNCTNYASYRQYHNIPTYQSAVGCKAYALDDNWLIAGAGCLWNGQHKIHIERETYYTGLVEENCSKNLIIDYIPIPMQDNLFVQPRFTLLPHFLLVRVPKNSKLAAVVKKMPKIDILSFVSANPLHLKGGTFYVNTSRFGLNKAKPRKLAAYNFKNKTVTIQEDLDDLASLANDPLLYVSQDNKVYWIGINDGVMEAYPSHRWDAKPSKNFIVFENGDLDFIQRIITEQDPSAWPRIAPRLHKSTVR